MLIAPPYLESMELGLPRLRLQLHRNSQGPETRIQEDDEIECALSRRHSGGHM